MPSIRDSAHRLNNQMQAILGLLELGHCEECLEHVKLSIATLDSVTSMITAHAKEFESVAAEVHRLAAQVVKFDAEAAEVDVAATEVHRLTTKFARKGRPVKPKC